ncbi:MAG: hypothetical protein V4773_10230 [Verrucomicrobiota bacterium]
MTLNRIFLICFAVLGVTCVTSYVVEVIERADDRAVHEQAFASGAKRDSQSIKSNDLDQFAERAKRRSESIQLRLYLLMGGLGLFMSWMIANTIRGENFWKKLNAPQRVADPHAGAAIAQLIQAPRRYVGGRGFAQIFLKRPRREIEVDPAAESIVFRGFTFIADFAGNRTVAEKTLRFDDILGGRIWVNKGQRTLALRTTAGQVRVGEDMPRLHEIIPILLDAAEVACSRPESYAAARVREPQVKIPSYGWLAVAVAAIIVVTGVVVLFWNL